MIFNSFLDYVRVLVEHPLLLFLFMFLFSVANLFFPPIPLESATLLVGYLSGTGRGILLVIIAATSLGMFCGSFFLYYLAKHHQFSIIAKTPLKKFVTKHSYQRAIAWFQKYGLWTLFLGKIVPGMGLYAVLCCGVFNIQLKKAVWAIFFSNLLFFTLLALTGRLLNENWGKAIDSLRKLSIFALLLLGIILICCLIFLIKHFKRKHN